MRNEKKNVGEIERVVSTAAGLLAGAYGASRRGVWKLPWLMASAALAKRGVTGKCDLYSALDISTLASREMSGNTPRARKQPGKNASIAR